MATHRLSSKESRQLIRELNLRNTPLRDELLRYFKRNEATAFSENELMESLNVPCDRTTLYRTIKILLQKAVIHKIVCENGKLKYALGAAGNQSHIHFQCVQCQRVFCLKSLRVQTPELPQEYEALSYHFLVKGNCHHCPDCSKN